MNPKIREILRFLVMFPMMILSCGVLARAHLITKSIFVSLEAPMNV